MKKPCFWLWLLALGLAAGCGYQGALQLPDAPPAPPAEQFSAMTG